MVVMNVALTARPAVEIYQSYDRMKQVVAFQNLLYGAIGLSVCVCVGFKCCRFLSSSPY